MSQSVEIDAAEREAAYLFMEARVDEIRAVCEQLEARSEYEWGAVGFAYALGRTRVTPSGSTVTEP